MSEYTEDANIKCAALSYAIKAACGTEIDEAHVGMVTTSPTKLIEAAKVIETYLKGTENVV